jgi:quercetin 2,3-dioxygenase
MIASPFFRSAPRVFEAARSLDGDGVQLRRAFPGEAVSEIDPFLLLDEMGPVEFPAGGARGFPPHPHRGFETVTYLLEGEMQHRDSWGNHGLLRPGDVQWMTAGSGLVHSELPGRSLVEKGGRLHGFQLWVNLPRRDKMLPPRYQDTPAERIPVVRVPGGLVTVKVIAGESLGVRGAIETRIPILYLHLTLAAGAEFQQDIPRASNALAYVVDGEVEAGGARVPQSHVAEFDRRGKCVLLRNAGAEDASVLLIAGQAIEEPVARRGPFVMNTREEIAQAVDDYHAGRMGTLV